MAGNATFTITYKVNGSGTIKNTAELQSTFKNKNNASVTDSSENDNKDYDWIQTKEYKVSLEKYVTQVNENESLTANETSLIERQGYRYNERGTNPDYDKGLNVSKVKYDNVVKVEQGDKVIYKIVLKNEGDTQVKITRIYDSFGYYDNSCKEKDTLGNKNVGLKYVKAETAEQGVTVEKTDENYQNPGEFMNRYLFTIKYDDNKFIEAGKTLEINITFEVNITTNLLSSEQILFNKAAIREIKNKNDKIVTETDGETDNYDMDWVKTQTYKVSLKKYASEITDKDGNNKVYVKEDGSTSNSAINADEARSSAKRDNENLTASTGRNTYKSDNPVKAEVGDIVTFTIALTNDGSIPVKITEIYDTFEFNTDGYNQLVKQTNDTKIINEAGNVIGYFEVVNEHYKENEKKYGGTILNDDIDDKNNDLDIWQIKLTYNSDNMIAAGATVYIKLKFQVNVAYDYTGVVSDTDTAKQDLYNKAGIVELQNKHNIVVKEGIDGEGTKDNHDIEHIQIKTNSIRLTKYVSQVKANSSAPYFEKYSGRDQYAEHNNDNDDSTNNEYKYNNVAVAGNGNLVTYTIKVTNTGNTKVTIPAGGITDYLPDGVTYNGTKYDGGTYCTAFENGKTDNKITVNNDSFTLNANDDNKTFTVTVTVDEPNMSLNILKNVAEVTSENLVNRNDFNVKDYTLYDNEDADYIKMDFTEDGGSVIKGTVWNDKATDKTSDYYDGKIDSHETKLSGIKVMLYRSGKGIVADKVTDSSGNYSFSNADLYSSLNAYEKYIKGPSKSNTDNKWAGTYYNYYVIFEYDGITYTSTAYSKWDSNDIANDAREKINTESYAGHVSKTRTAFNNKFSTINNASGITYKTVNEDGYIPQSIHVYDSNTMAMQSSTEKIILSNSATVEDQIKHIDCGLRGRDIFDLELTSDVYSTKVTVNGVSGGYNYNSNKITVRRNDCNNYSYLEDSANIYAQTSDYIGERYNQYIRNSDITNSAYDTTGLAIEVTYKITIRNASITPGTATKIINYYDNKYTLKGAYSDSSCNSTLTIENKGSGTGYKSVEITTQGTKLQQSDKMEIYVVYTLNDAADTLKKVTDDELATFNMAEISEYKTECGTGQSEATRGLIDKDSAPGSAATENVRLTPNLIGSSNTVEYYFSGNDLSKLKYEDDTYATPTLYFVKDDDERTITGTVFEDNTTTNSTTKIKTGNGVMDSGEVGVYGATVELIEQVDGGKVRYTTTTNANGEFRFSGFLPGNYIIRYYYGDKVETVLLHQSNTEAQNSANNKSYNGEDFQATNNKYKIEGMDTNQLNTTANYWYIFNEDENARVSTATDDDDRRKEVSENVTNFTDEEMTVLNQIRDGENVSNENIDKIIQTAKMNANTPVMRFEVEKAIEEESTIYQNTAFNEYEIKYMNFGIAEVPVTTIDLKKSISKFTIKDSTGQNVIAGFDENGGSLVGFVTTPNNIMNKDYWAQIEDKKLQGARLEITYKITLEMKTEKNFDGTATTVPTVTGMVDFVNNNLSYNTELDNNEEKWEVTTYVDTLNTLETMKYKTDGSTPQGTIDPTGTKYTTIVKATGNNKLLNVTISNNETTKVEETITLEKVLTAMESKLDIIITNLNDSYDYSNTVEIIQFDYGNTTTSEGNKMRDRIRTPERYIILPGVQHDYAISDSLIITPPTGDTSISTLYYIIALISLVILVIVIWRLKAKSKKVM